MTKQEADRVKAFLRQAEVCDRRMKRMYDRLTELRSKLTYSPPGLSGGGGSGSDRLTAGMEKLIRLEEQASQLREEYAEVYFRVSDAISSVGNDTLEELLELRYLHYRKWEDIAHIMHYSLRRVHQLHGRALEKLKDCT